MSEQVSVREATERTAAASLAEFAARRRGPLRRFFIRHPVAMDIVVVLVYLCLTAPGIVLRADGQGPTALIVVGLTAAALGLRRLRPVAILAVVAVLEVAAVVADSGVTNVGAGLWFALYAVAVTHPARFTFLVTCAATLPAILALALRPPDAFDAVPLLIWVTAALVLLSEVVAAGIGATVRRDRRHTKELLARAQENAELASVTERTRIAREMHDVVAHSLSVMIALSDGAGVVIKRDQQRASEVLDELSKTGRAALADMRRVLGVLREHDQEDAPFMPLPAEKSLTSLVESFRLAGLPIRYTRSGPALPSDPAFQLTVYRIVQESLTNVLRYGNSVTAVDVLVAREADKVNIRVSDDGRGTLDGAPAESVGAGLGIVGMAERVGIYSGAIDAGPGSQGGWVVDATLIWPEHGGDE